MESWIGKSRQSCTEDRQYFMVQIFPFYAIGIVQEKGKCWDSLAQYYQYYNYPTKHREPILLYFTNIREEEDMDICLLIQL